MANNKTRPLSRVKPATLFAAVAVGAVTATVGICVPPAAIADPGYPSWDEVAKAKQNEAAEARTDRRDLRPARRVCRHPPKPPSKTSLIAAEAYRVTQDKLDAATAA